MKILKFGGSSVAKPERIKGVIEILKHKIAAKEKFAVVFSAFGGVTDSLIKMSNLAEKADPTYLDLFQTFSQRHFEAAKQLVSDDLIEETSSFLTENHTTLKKLLEGIYLVQEASPRTMDYVLSFGEINSNFIISNALRSEGVDAAFLDARKVVKTDRGFNAAKVNFDLTYSKIQEHFASTESIQVVTGFISSTKGGLTTTLGRGGSDYTASLFGAALQTDAIEIWTDVNGVLTADPRKVQDAFTIEQMTYAEAMEMSHFGAKVIYPPTLQPALKATIPIYIKNTFQPEHPGTFISTESDPNEKTIKGISSISDIALLTLEGSGLFGVPGIAGRLFSTLANGNINVILITQGSSESSISFAIAPNKAKKAKKIIEKHFEFEISNGYVLPVKIELNLSVIAIIGENMRYQTGIAGRLFEALGKNGINAVAIAQGSSELNLSVVINATNESKALNALHQAFFLSDKKVLNIFMVGVGLIGGTLLEQISDQHKTLITENALDVRITGLANSKKMVFAKQGIDSKEWKNALETSDDKMEMTTFINTMKELNLNNSIFIDNTASDKVSSFYEDILSKSISISTPNKVSTSGSYANYQKLKGIAKKKGVQFMYETNVGAGLPVLSTLRDLIRSGDKIQKIEAVLSGSLSFIFNSYDGSRPFSQVVKEAKEKGFTEPDPRLDLSGLDIKRKIVILAREAGYAVEPDEVSVSPFLSDACMNASSEEAFWKLLEEESTAMETRRKEAEANGKVLRMMAKFEGGKASVGLEAVTESHPFFRLNGSDNMIIFSTARYKERPLVVVGPGAGADVTAAGVFAEVLKIGYLLS